jgi:hypothetical protein
VERDRVLGPEAARRQVPQRDAARAIRSATAPFPAGLSLAAAAIFEPPQFQCPTSSIFW